MKSNLVASMARKRISYADISRLLGVHPETVSNKVNGITAFTIDEAELLWRTYFPESDYWWLFRADVA